MPHEPRHKIHPTILQHARDLRHPLTPAEKKVWAGVRNRRLGYKIRRQHPIFRVIADFCCEEARLVIEIDGDGYRVIRFTNREVHENLGGVLEAIRASYGKNSNPG